MNAKTRATLPDWLWELLQRLDDELVLRGCVRQTRSPYSAHVRRFYAGRPRTDPVAKDGEVRSWMLDMLRSGLSHSYANQALSALRFLHRHVLNAPAPVADIPRPKREKRLPKILSESEVRRFLDELGSPKHRAITFILYSAGLRVGEAARLQVEDVDSQRGQIHVRRGKGGKDRYAILSSVVLAVLREYVRVDRPVHWLFPGGHRPDRHITTRSIQRQVSRAGKRAGIQKRVTPQMLRHSFATHLLEGGTDLKSIQELLGHEKIPTTVIYTHMAQRNLRKVKSPIDRLFEDKK